MRTSVSEEESLRTNPEEFVKLALDTCDRQVFISLFIEVFKYHLFGILRFLTHISVLVLNS